MTQKLDQQLKTKKVKCNSLELCSRCLHYEINSWMEEKWKYISEETKNKILEELKAIELSSGECLVCRHDIVAVNTPGKILGLLEQSETPKKVSEEFRQFFCL